MKNTKEKTNAINRFISGINRARELIGDLIGRSRDIFQTLEQGEKAMKS